MADEAVLRSNGLTIGVFHAVDYFFQRCRSDADGTACLENGLQVGFFQPEILNVQGGGVGAAGADGVGAGE